jgi:retinol dehydrogenase 12
MAQWPPLLPSLSGRTALVTGANTGIGFVTAMELARVGARVHLACRNEEKARAAMERIRAEVPEADLEFLSLDLDSLVAVRASAAAFLATGEPLNLLINNAGLVGRGTTKDGFEKTFGVNHIGVFLFTTLLLDKLKESTPSRIVNVASNAHTRTRGIDLDGVRRATPSGTGFGQYAQSKLANVLFSAELASRLEGTGVLTVSLHPGAIATDVWRDIPGPFRWFLKLSLLSVEDGARTTLHCATAADLQTGAYYAKERVTKTSAAGADRELGRALWAASEEWVRGGTP